MLRATILNKELNENQRNENHVLTSLMNAYERHFSLPSEQLRQFRDSQHCVEQLGDMGCALSSRTLHDDLSTDIRLYQGINGKTLPHQMSYSLSAKMEGLDVGYKSSHSNL